LTVDGTAYASSLHAAATLPTFKNGNAAVAINPRLSSDLRDIDMIIGFEQLQVKDFYILHVIILSPHWGFIGRT